MRTRVLEVVDDMIFYRGWRVDWEYDLDNQVSWKAWVEGDKIRHTRLDRLLEQIDYEEELQ